MVKFIPTSSPMTAMSFPLIAECKAIVRKLWVIFNYFILLYTPQSQF